jgi:hypothetical protein
MPPVLYVKIIWQITSYSTLFILKRNTGNCFYFLSYVRLSGIFLEKVHQKTLFRTTQVRLYTSIFFLGVDIWTAIPSQSRPRTESGGTAYWWEARLIELTVNQSLDNRGSTVSVSAQNIVLEGWWCTTNWEDVEERGCGLSEGTIPPLAWRNRKISVHTISFSIKITLLWTNHQIVMDMLWCSEHNSAVI